MGYAKHIGRVGGLAVALGVGVAVATTPGIAWADDTTSPPSSDGSSGSTPPGTEASNGSDTTTTTNSPTTTTSGDGTTAPKVTYDSSGGAEESTNGDSDPGADDPAPTTSKPKPAGNSGSNSASTATTPKKPKRSSLTVATATATSEDAGAVLASPKRTQSPKPTKSTTEQQSVEPVAVQSVASMPSTDVPRSVVVLQQPVPEDAGAIAPDSPSTVSKLLSWAGLGLPTSGAAGDLPDMPPESPVLLAMLAWGRSKSQESLVEDEASTLTADTPQSSLMMAEDNSAGEPMLMAAALTANQAPTVGAQPTGIPDPATGVVSGQVVASDTDGNTLTYSVTGTSTNGGTVTINPTTGAYTYTPTAAQRLAAGTTTGADTDTFTVDVFDGQTTTTGTVPVYVSPTQLNTGTPISVGNQPVGVAVYENPNDPTKNRTYVINQYDKTVSVIDTNPNSTTYNKQIATIKLASTPSDIVLNSTGTRAYVAMKGNASVAVINTNTNKVIDVNPATTTVDSIKVGSTPTGIAISPDNTRLYVTNGGGSTVSVIDTSTNKEISRITVGSQPSGIAVKNGKLYVTLRYSDSLAIVNLADNTKTLVKVGDSPREVVLNSDGSRAYVTNYDGTVSVVNTVIKTQVVKITTGGPKYQPAGVAIDANRGLVYVANGKDTVSVIDTKTNAIIQTLTIDSAAENGQHWIALSPDGTRIYVTDFNDDNLRTLSLTRGNTAPVAIASPTVGTPNVYTGAVSGLVNIKDPDGDPLTYEFFTQRDGTVSYDAATDTYTYTPTQAARYQASYNPGLTDTVSVHTTDPQGAEKTVFITVPISGNFNPATGVTTGSVNVGGTTAHTYHVTSSPTYGSVVLDENTGDFTYTSFAPNDGYFALWYDSFSWEATDGQSTQTGTVTVDTYVDPYILYGMTW